ncbi:MgtC/SapB family protein [Alkaliphilus serpentinus]|uniref:MgtC/SapB family protein n=1 Tax=Alkaliphilus serpentinus TaxID=1482731 RepID=A0A833HPY9_9FIRM|nr:MgtC/SapB family protein [Alkaliphilus serpentinus]KAB3530259.1 MgtC/SapB family protein [Alkaliphilus serpentinus]
MLSVNEIIIRLALAVILGGLVGIERESIRRAAGFRTHILVCIGASLVMLLSLHLYGNYRNYSDIDPARLGAQVISGMGFLGAGTIIREGNTIKGLTTAASLWTVAAIGLAIGAGFYTGAIIATITVLLALKVFTHLEIYIPDKRSIIAIQLTIDNVPGQLGRVAEALGKNDISIIQVSLDMMTEESETALLTLKVKSKGNKQHEFHKEDIAIILKDTKGIRKITII